MSDVVVILEKLKEEGFSLWLDGEKLRYKAPKESITKANLLTLKRNKEEIIQVLQNYSKRIVVEVDSDNRYEPFPLTDVQTAYLMGRNNLFDYGGVACHVYLELKYKNLDVSRVRLVWNKLIQTHDMLRTVVFEEGYQQVLKEVPELEIPYWDVSKGENICEYNDFRQQMGNHVYDTGKWPMFGIAIAKKAEESILHFSMDFLIADWTSIWMLLSEFEALYYLKKDSINVPQITFRDYLSAERKLKESERYVNDKRYWEKRIAYLPDAPELPTLSAEDVKKNFTRKLLCLDSERWNSFKDAAKKLGITPSTAILTAYSDVIAKWSCNKSFCINLTVLNRFPLHDDVTDIVGDFTTLNLLEINANDGNNFAERARKINERLFIDLDHRLFGGVEVIRELSKQRNKRVFMPIVYTSAIGLADQNRQITGKFDGGITQTPQVFIDCQAMDGDFGLQINWDVREGVFPDGMIDDMFDLFQQRIEELAKDETDWNKINGLFLPQWQADERNVANHTETDLPIHLLQSGFMEWAQKAPDRVAVTDGEKKLTYGELHQYALKIRQKIVNVGAKHQDCIAIAMNKSIYQVAAVLGTLYAGCIYVPIVADQEIERAKKILEITNANIVLTTVAENSEYMSGKAIIEVDALSDIKFETELPEYGLEDVAYIIFTSGSTGEPKGVTITHGALGSVDVYRYLIPEMEKQNCGEIISIGISDLDEYCKLESEEVVLHLADLYTQKILEENLDKVQIVGYSFSGVIAIEMAKQLLEAGIDVEDVAIIDGGSIPVEIQDEIIYELFFIGNLHVSLEKLEFTDLKVFEKIFGKIVDSKQDSISISDFEDSQEDCHIYERLLELSQLTQEVRFKTYLSVSDDSSVRNFNFDMVKHLYTIFKKSFAALRFVPTVYFGDIRYFKTTERNGIFKYFEALLQEWDDVCIGDFEIIEIAGNHYSCLENPNYAHELAKKLGSVYEEWREE